MPVHGRTCSSGTISFSEAAGDCRSIVAAYGDWGLDTYIYFGLYLTSSGSGNRTICSHYIDGSTPYAHSRIVGDCIYLPSGSGGVAEAHTIVTINNTSKFTVASDLTQSMTSSNACRCAMTRDHKMSNYYRKTSGWPTRTYGGQAVNADLVHPYDRHGDVDINTGVAPSNIASGNPISFSNFYCTGGTYCACLCAGSTTALSIGYACYGSQQTTTVTVNGSSPQGGGLRCIGWICNDKNYGDVTSGTENVGRESWRMSGILNSGGGTSGNSGGYCCVGYTNDNVTPTWCLPSGSYISYAWSAAATCSYSANICLLFFSGVHESNQTPAARLRWYWRHDGSYTTGGLPTSYCLIYTHWDGRMYTWQ